MIEDSSPNNIFPEAATEFIYVYGEKSRAKHGSLRRRGLTADGSDYGTPQSLSLLFHYLRDGKNI